MAWPWAVEESDIWAMAATPPHGAASPRPSGLARAASWSLRALVVLIAVVVAGAPSGLMEGILRWGVDSLVPADVSGSPLPTAVPGALVLTALALLAVTAFGVPVVWRRSNNPAVLRLCMYVSLQTVAVALGLLVSLNAGLGQFVSWAFGGAGTVVWWSWQKKWRGAGLAPSPLTGILKPAILPGQIWYAFVQGRQEGKVRPVLVLNWDGTRHGWICAYFTSQPPPSPKIAAGYIAADVGAVRGLDKRNWLRVSETRALGRRAFRSYTGLAPRWLYDAACVRAGCPPHADARTVDERSAGHSKTAFELALLDALGVRQTARQGMGEDAKAASSFLRRLLSP